MGRGRQIPAPASPPAPWHGLGHRARLSVLCWLYWASGILGTAPLGLDPAPPGFGE